MGSELGLVAAGVAVEGAVVDAVVGVEVEVEVGVVGPRAGAGILEAEAVGKHKDIQAGEDTAGTDIVKVTDAKGVADDVGDIVVEAAGVDVDVLGEWEDGEQAERSALEVQTAQRSKRPLLFPISDTHINCLPKLERKTYILKLGKYIVIHSKLLKFTLDIHHHLVDDGAVHLGLFIVVMGFSLIGTEPRLLTTIRFDISWLLYLSRLSTDGLFASEITCHD